MYGPPLTRSGRCITYTAASFTLITVIVVMITPRRQCYVATDLMYKGSPADTGYMMS